MASAWITFPCSSVQARWRYLDDGRIEVEDVGVVKPKKWPAGVTKWKDAILALSAQYNTPPHWIAALMAVEDPAGDPKATSSAGAIGLMQLMPGTAKIVGASIGKPLTSNSDLYDPLYNLELGVAHFAGLLKRYKGEFVSAAIAYNAGQIICLSATTKCQKGYWGVCTDGSPYPLWVIQGSNGALDNGFGSPNVPIPPLYPSPKPWAITLVSAVGAYVGFMATRKMQQQTSKHLRWI
jgi:hypothetical protein